MIANRFFFFFLPALLPACPLTAQLQCKAALILLS